MTHKFVELYELMPKKDCGACGNPSCRTMARKIAAGDAQLEQCINLQREEYRGNLEKIRRIVAEGIEIGAKGTVIIGEEGITYIHPCISEAGKVAAETRLTAGPEGPVNLKYGFFDPVMMCWALNTSGLFKDVRCSSSLGVARVNIDGKTVMISQDGRINVRRAKDKEDALRTTRLVARSLWGALICSCCGNAGVDCASGGCDDCITRVCPVLAGGPPDPTQPQRTSTGETSGLTMFDRVKQFETYNYFEKALQHLNNSFNAFNDSLERLLKEGYVIEPKVEEELQEANRWAMKFIVETPRIQDASIGLIISGVAMDIRRMSEAYDAIAQNFEALKNDDARRLLEEALFIARNSYNSFMTADPDKAATTADLYMKFRDKWKEAFSKPLNKDFLVAVEKIATNGFYVARLINKPIPA